MSNIVISFPKSGRTWLRALLGYLICSKNHVNIRKLFNHNVLVSYEKNFPRFTHDGIQKRSRSLRRIKRTMRRHRRDKVVFVIRDIKDTMVSYYFHSKFRKSRPYNGSISDFIRGKKGVDRCIWFNNLWTKNIRRKRKRNILVISYENLHKDAQSELRKIIRFFRFTGISAADLDLSVTFCSFENMQKMERSKMFKRGFFVPTNVNDIRTYKTREGKTGGHTKYLSLDDIDFINQRIEAGNAKDGLKEEVKI